jgi:hypothetical protein
MQVLLIFLSLHIVLSDYLPQAMTEDPESDMVEDMQFNKTEEPPLMHLIEPYSRNGAESANSSVYPCGGLPKGKTHLLITPGSNSIIQWKTVKSAPEGKCLIRISHGIANESTFVTLYPRDKSSNSEGYFECGRYSGMYETKEFPFPFNLSCDTCTLQLTWETPEFKKYYCTDITIMSDEVKYCMGSCLNGGSCVNGNCVCEEPYYGKFCENKEKISVPVGKMLIFYILLSALILVLCFAIYKTWPTDNEKQGITKSDKKGSVLQNIADKFGDNQPTTGPNRDRHGDYQNPEREWQNEYNFHNSASDPAACGEESKGEGGQNSEPKNKSKYPGEESQVQEKSPESKVDSEVSQDEQSIGQLKGNIGRGLIDDF